MASLNKCAFIGNLGRDPEVTYTAGGKAICKFSIACSETWKDKSGQKQEATEWVNIVMFDKLAEIAGEYLKKGSQVYVEGKVKTNVYEKDGEKKYSTSFVCHEMKMLGGKQEGGQPSPSQGSKTSAKDYAKASTGSASADQFDDDIPF